MARLTVVVENLEAAPCLRRDLERGGHKCHVISMLSHVQQEIMWTKPDLVVVDGESPFAWGAWYETLCERIAVPVFALVSAADETVVVRALRAGADGCLVKPYSRETLLAHIDACLRRYLEWSVRPQAEPLGPSLDPDSYTVGIGDKEVRLSTAEYRLLECLLDHRGRVVSREALSSHVWGERAQHLSDTNLNLCVYNLRNKIEDQPGQPAHILTRWGVGYYWADD